MAGLVPAIFLVPSHWSSPRRRPGPRFGHRPRGKLGPGFRRDDERV